MKGGALATLFAYTVFRDIKARTKAAKEGDLIALAKLVERTTASKKDALPLVNIGRFGDVKSDKWALRHSENLKAVYGLEADYHAGEISPAEAAQRLAEAQVSAMVYNPARRPVCPDKWNRWRVLCPFSGRRSPQDRAHHVTRVNRFLGGVPAGGSFNLSQACCMGGIGGHETEMFLVRGDHIDTRPDLDAGAIGPVKAKLGGPVPAIDQSDGTVTAVSIG